MSTPKELFQLIIKKSGIYPCSYPATLSLANTSSKSTVKTQEQSSGITLVFYKVGFELLTVSKYFLKDLRQVFHRLLTIT